jgi:hypothetical protein
LGGDVVHWVWGGVRVHVYVTEIYFF